MQSSPASWLVFRGAEDPDLAVCVNNPPRPHTKSRCKVIDGKTVKMRLRPCDRCSRALSALKSSIRKALKSKRTAKTIRGNFRARSDQKRWREKGIKKFACSMGRFKVGLRPPFNFEGRNQLWGLLRVYAMRGVHCQARPWRAGGLGSLAGSEASATETVTRCRSYVSRSSSALSSANRRDQLIGGVRIAGSQLPEL